MERQNYSGVDTVKAATYTDDNLPATLYLPIYSYSPEEIFSGNILLFNVDFFGDKERIYAETEDGSKYYVDEYNSVTELESKVAEDEKEIKAYYYDKDGEKVATSTQNIGVQLRDTISRWYVALRNIALVVMMIVLLYIGIRMLLSTLSTDKAKYRQMLQDWFMGVLILFFMHYIMAFSVTIVQRFTDLVSTTVSSERYVSMIPNDSENKLHQYCVDNGMWNLLYNQDGTPVYEADPGEGNADTSKKDIYLMYPSNLLGYSRIRLQLANWGTEYLGYALVFIILVIYTAVFTFTYLKRVLYMAFLTLMAPLVSVTYPIDKMNDGSAQGFNKWFKEYIFNLLIQPLHLLLYYILITSAFDLAADNVLYSLVAIGFMIPAEKLLRSFFGFQKSETAGTLSSAAGGALAMGAISKLSGGVKKAISGKSGGGKGSSSDSGDDENTAIKMPGDIDRTQALIEEGESPNTSGTANETTQEAATAGVMNGEGNTTEGNSAQEQDNSQQINSANNRQIDNNGEEDNGQQNEENSQWDALKSNAQMRMARYGGAVKAGLSDRRDKTRRKIRKNLKALPGKAVRFTGKAVAGVAIGGGLGAVGIAAGAAMGDPSKAATYAAGATAAGFAATYGALSNRSPLDKEAFNQAYNDPKYDDLHVSEQLKDFKANYRGTLERNFDKDKAKEILKKGGLAEQAIRNNVSDIDEVVAMQQMIDDKEVKDAKGAIAVAQTHQKLQDYSKAEQDKFWDKEVKAFESKGETHEKAIGSKDLAKGKVDKFDKYKKGVRK